MPRRKGVLLTDEAVRATRAFDLPHPHPQTWEEADENIRALVGSFLCHHATDGRAPLTAVLTAKSGYHGVALDRSEAERVVTALFGDPGAT